MQKSVATLPALRQDLQLFEGPEGSDGAPTWAIYDPVRNRHFKIGRKAFAMLSRWHEGTVEAISTQLKAVAGLNFSTQDFQDLLKFLTANSLVETRKSSESANLFAQYSAATKKDLAWLGRNVFFFRLPLLRAESLLKILARVFAFAFTRSFRNLVLAVGLIGFYLAARQFDSFLTSFDYFFTWQGMAMFLVSLVLLKILHEFAHGITATRFGARVSNMGVAFMVMFPVLYTDVSDSWRIRSRRQRLLIGAAGIIVELYIALVCTFLWSFLPDGVYRSAAFFLATTSWIWTLAINVNPFMKFDGYYLLSDYWGVENLQNRAFALGRWRLREILFDLEHPLPEVLPANKANQLIVYAWLTWGYRLFLFLSIGYFFLTSFFKLAAIILLLISGYRFLGKPVLDELKTWATLRMEILKRPRSYITAMALVCIIFMLFFPWVGKVSAPGILIPENRTVLYPVRPAMINEIHIVDRDIVRQGDILFKLTDPALEEQIKLTEKKKSLIKLKLDRRAASAVDRANLLILNQELAEQETTLAGLNEQLAQLEVRAPFNGRVVNLNETVQVGRWVDASFELAQLVENNSLIIEAVLGEFNLAQIKVGDSAEFVPDELELAPLAAHVVEIERANLPVLHVPYLQSTYGGKVAVRIDEDGNNIPEKSVFRLVLALQDLPAETDRVIRGVAVIDGVASSIAGRVYKRVAAVLIRESGF